MSRRIHPVLERAYLRLPHGTVLIAVLIGLHILLKLSLLPYTGSAPLLGDESQYVDGAKALSNLVRDVAGLGPFDSAELERNVIGNGWFMPGMSVLLTPLFVVEPDASTFLVRIYLGLATTILLLLAVRSVRRTFGDRFAVLLLVFPGLVPMWVVFSFGAWGDLIAGLLVLVLVAHLVTIFRQVRSGVAFTIGEGAWLGLLGISVVYLRSSATLLVGGMFIIVLVSAAVLLRSRQRIQALAALGAAGLVFFAVLAPWSIGVSESMGTRVMTTTSVSNSLANTFGDRDKVCFGQCDPGSTIWFNPLRYSREVARATGLSEVEVQAEMSTYARKDVTAQSYARDVVADIGRYALTPAGYADVLGWPQASGIVYWGVVVVSSAMFYVMLLLVGWALLLATRRSFDSQILSITVKLGIGALFTQPFVHVSSSRYWPSAAPLFALAAGLYLQVHSERQVLVGVGHDLPALEDAVENPSPSTVHYGLYLIQLFLVGATILVAAGIAVLEVLEVSQVS